MKTSTIILARALKQGEFNPWNTLVHFVLSCRKAIFIIKKCWSHLLGAIIRLSTHQGT